MIRYTEDGKVDRSPVPAKQFGCGQTWYEAASPEELADALDAANASLRAAEERERKLRDTLERIVQHFTQGGRPYVKDWLPTARAALKDAP